METALCSVVFKEGAVREHVLCAGSHERQYKVGNRNCKLWANTSVRSSDRSIIRVNRLATDTNSFLLSESSHSQPPSTATQRLPNREPMHLQPAFLQSTNRDKRCLFLCASKCTPQKPCSIESIPRHWRCRHPLQLLVALSPKVAAAEIQLLREVAAVFSIRRNPFVLMIQFC